MYICVYKEWGDSMWRILSLLSLSALSSCGVWSSTIRSDVVDYSDVLETTTNQFLLVNILQARDDAPLHFAALPNIHGSLQATASLAGTLPYEQGIEGTRAAAMAATVSTPGTAATPAAAFLNASITPTITVQSSPSFEVDSVEAKDFVTGMSSPIDPKFIKYWVDRGLDKRIILLLFFSSAQITEKIYATDKNGDYIWIEKNSKKIKGKTPAKGSDQSTPCKKSEKNDPSKCEREVLGTQTITIYNSPRSAADQLIACWTEPNGSRDRCHRRTQFEHYLTLVDAIKDDVTANAYTERKKLSRAFPLDLSRNLRGLGTLDTTKYKLEYQTHNKYALFATSSDQNIVLCFNRSFPVSGGGNGQRTDDSNAMCTKTIVTKEAVDPDKRSDATDYPINPDTDISYSGKCESDSLKSSNGGPDLDYCAIFNSFLCYANSPPIVHGPKDVATHRNAPLANTPLELEAGCEASGLQRDSSTAELIWPEDAFTLQFNVRSVGEMIRFLGDLVYYQEKLAIPDDSHNIPLTLGWNKSLHPEGAKSTGTSACPLGDGGCLFKISEDTDNGRVNVHYRGHSYSIAEHQPNDHSLEILAIVNQLVNLNHSAADLRTTPTVQIVP